MIAWLAGAALAGPEWRGAVGGQLEQASHGILDFGLREGPWSGQLFTDTLDLRWDRSGDRGRVGVGLRAVAFAAGMWITPWEGGAPDPSRAQRATYVGPDLVVQRWLGRGWYAGGEAFARPHFFAPLPGATLEVPDTFWARADGVLGAWLGEGAVTFRLAAGLDLTASGPVVPSPHATLEVTAAPPGAIVPLFELRAGVASAQDDLTATRLGGMTPYHVPVGGLAWAEHWVEDYVALRVGERLTLGAVALPFRMDVAAWRLPADTSSGDPPVGSALGLSGGVEVRAGGWFGDLMVGYAPTVRRPEGIWPVPVYLLVGSSWR